MPKLRKVLGTVPAYVPGRKVPGAAILASNESPYGLLPSVASVLAEHLAGVSRYPDMSSTALIEAIAAHHDVDPARVAVGAGSVEVCSQLAASVVDDGNTAKSAFAHLLLDNGEHVRGADRLRIWRH